MNFNQNSTLFHPNERFNKVMTRLVNEHPSKMYDTDSDIDAMRKLNLEMSSIQKDYQAKEQMSLALASKVRLK